jgi:hypothetical protein
LKPINRHQDAAQNKRESPVVELKKREKKRKKEGLQPTALLLFAAAAQYSNVRWELSGYDPSPCVVFFLYL